MKRTFILFSLFLTTFHGPTIAAVHLSNNSSGQVAIVPFYSVVDGNETHLRVLNTGDQYKAVRVNVRTADISAKSVYSINVYLRPHDTWRMAMGKRGDFIAAINTDTTCTLGLTDPGDQAVDWSNHIWETGFMEVIEMGNISPATIGQYVDENEYCSLMEEACRRRCLVRQPACRPQSDRRRVTGHHGTLQWRRRLFFKHPGHDAG